MRYSLYLYIKEMIETLIEAAEFVKKSDNEKLNIQLSIDSINVLDEIKKVLNENEESVKSPMIMEKLSLYRERAFELVSFYEKGLNNATKEIDEYTEDIEKLKTIFIDSVEMKYHVVFFAELGQKWDSMNSVYEAFNKRKDCDVKVVLTPIFRAIQSNGEVEKEIIYEDYLTPLGINSIPYDQYDVSKELPDIAFISNPYESVTLPQFWPKNLSKYTRLVYLPYYTGTLINSNSIKTHCGLPIAKYAWKIIAQSPRVKVLHQRYAPKKGENVLVTGLPKWDDIVSINKESITMDVEWQKKLRGKKVFLWNNHYNINSAASTLLEYGEHIIDYFQNRDDIALIWRPHPMTETIFKLYLSQHYSFWNRLKGTVDMADNIVLDINKSSNIAIKISDALISDLSSMITQYLLTEKPVLLLKKTMTDQVIESSEELISVKNLEHANNLFEIEQFITNINNGIDKNKNLRLKIINEELYGADGLVGERVCKLLLKELQNNL